MITGLIDWERSIWGIPCWRWGLGLIQTTLFRNGYGIKEFTKSQERRSLWYDIYLFVLVSLECEYRKYETMDMYQWATYMLTTLWGKLRC